MDKLSKPTSNFTVVSNQIFKKTDISGDARFVWIYLFSKPDGWIVHMKDIERMLGCGRSKTMRIRAELIDSGLLSYQRKKDGGGVYSLHEITTVRKPNSGKPNSGKSHRIVNTEREVNTDKDILCKKDFARWWLSYPKKKGKADALKAWMELKPKAGVLIADTEKRKQEDESWQRDNGQYIPMPANYLRGERWKDDMTTGSLPHDDNKLQAWASEKGMRMARPGESSNEYRSALVKLNGY